MTMTPCFYSSTPPASTSIAKFISDQPYLSMLESKCTTMKDLQKLHAQLIKTGVARDNIAASRVLAFCATSPGGDLNYARQLFDKMPSPNLFIWNTLIRGFSRSSTPETAITIFIDMLLTSPIEPERLTYPSIFKAYSQLGLARDGAQLHGRVIKQGLTSDPFIRNTIIHMYANCGFLTEAHKIFDVFDDFDVVAWNSMILGHAKFGEITDSRRLFMEMPSRNVVSWNSMISGYVRNGMWNEALNLFTQMQEQKIKPSEFTLVSLLNASAQLGAYEQGKWIHTYIQINNIELNSILLTAIINMYCKCGAINIARQVFEETPKRRGLSCWNSMIFGLAMNGREKEAIELFSKLESPDSVSFVGVLTACNHSGLVNEAKYYFSLMIEKHKIKPSIQHYGCMVDVLARSGLLKEAVELITTMPMKPDSVIWGCLVSACLNHGETEMGKWAANRLIESDPNDSNGYVVMANMYAGSGQFERAMEERVLMKKKKIEKQPGSSLIEVNGEVQEFVAGGRLHPQVKDICITLYGH